MQGAGCLFLNFGKNNDVNVYSVIYNRNRDSESREVENEKVF